MTDVKLELETAIAQLKFFLEEREQVEVKIAKQRQKVAAWEILAAQDDASSAQLSLGSALDGILDREGLTDACCTVLRGSSKEWMTTSDIQAALRDFGFDLGKYKAPHAAIMTTVTRLVEKTEVTVRRSGIGESVAEYKWIGSRFSAGARKKYGAENSLANQMAGGRLVGPKEAQLLAMRDAQKKGEK